MRDHALVDCEEIGCSATAFVSGCDSAFPQGFVWYSCLARPISNTQIDGIPMMAAMFIAAAKDVFPAKTTGMVLRFSSGRPELVL